MKKPEHILNEWVIAVNKGDIKHLLALYDKSAILIPTFSNRLLKTPKDLRDYFVRLRNRKGLSVELHKNTLIIQKIKEDVFTLSGIYRWRFFVDDELLTFEPDLVMY